MTYGYSNSKRGRKASRSKTKQLEVRRILASLTMAAGLLAYPFGVGEAATEIVRKDGTGPAIAPNGNIYNIEPEGISNNFAYNRFEKFNLDQGHIANLQFQKGSQSADALANLVNSKVNIDGIVNGVKGGAINGHLIFLSPNGIAIGANGVINAGQFTGIVPTQAAFDTLYKSQNPDTDITKAAIDALTSYANDKTIDVSGHINTHSGVMLGAGIININDGAKIESTKELNFTDVVNTGSSYAFATTGSGGDIILKAKQVSDVKDTNAIRWKDRSTDLSAAVNIGENVIITNKDRAVKLTAESTSKYEDSTPMTLTTTLRDAIFGNEATSIDGLIDKLAKNEAGATKYLFVNYSSKKNKSSVNIGQNSAITGNNIEVAATSTVEITQSVASGAAGKTDSNGNEVSSGSAAVVAVAVSRVYNNADIVIDGNLTANGADTDGSGIKLAANADTKVSLSAAGNGGAANAVAVGVAVLAGDTKAKVTVNAPAGATNLTANNGKVSVEATTQNDVGVKVNAVGNTSYVASNVGVANYDTSADVIINRSIKAGAVDINAENKITGLKLTVDNTANTSAPAKDTEERNDTEDNNAAQSQGDDTNEKKSVDPTKLIKNSSVDTSNTQDTQTQDAAGAIQNVQNRVAGTNESGTNSSGNNGSGNNAQQNSAFGLGASVGVVSNKNDANVTIGKNVVIEAAKPSTSGASTAADGSVNVTAKSLMTASAEHEDTLQFTVKNALANANVEIGAAVLVSNVKNNATVLLDNEGTNAAQITGGAVTIDAKAGMGKYNKPTTNGTGSGAGTGNGGAEGSGNGAGTGESNNSQQGTGSNAENNVEEKTSVLTYTVSAEGTSEEETPSTFALSGSVGVNTLKNNAIVLLGQNSQVTGSAVTLSSDAATGAEGTYGATDDNGHVGIGASVGIQNIRGNSLVMVGKGVQLTGTESLAASASNEMDLKNSVQNAGKGNSVGVSGMVALSYGDSNSIVSLDDEVAINAGSLTVTSMNSTNVENSARTESGGTAGAKAFGIGVGIVNYDVNSIAMVADNGSGISAPSENTTDEQKAAKKIAEDAILAQKVAGTTLAGKLGVKTAENATKGSITTGGLVGAAVTTGMIQNDAKANANAAPKESDSGSTEEGNNNNNANANQDSDRWTQWTNQGTTGANEARTNTQNLEQDNVTSQNESAAPSASGAAGEAGRAANPDQESSSDSTSGDGDAASGANSGSAGASIGIEGSAALTFLGGRTDAVLDNVTVKSGTDSEPAPVLAVSLSATDFLGSITLGGTGVKNKLEEGSSATTVGIGGTFAMNSSNRDVDSLIRNSDLPMALMVSNSASKTGIEVAAGMGASSSNSNGTSVAGAGVVYYNKAKQDVHALLINNNVMGASVSNQATSTDFQIAGGLSGNASKVGVGGAVAISNLENNLSSGIIGGNYTVLSSVDVEAQKGTTQINGALAGTKGTYGFEGAFAYGSVKNTTRAYISNAASDATSRATVTGLSGSVVNVKAGEIPVVTTTEQLTEEKTKIDNKIDNSINSDPNTIDTQHTYTQLDDTTKTNAKTQLKNQANAALDKEKQTQESNKQTLTNKGIDTTGASYLDKSSNVTSSLDDNAANTDAGEAAGDAAGDENTAKDELGTNRSITITAAMGGGWNSNTGAGAGIAYNYVKNDIAADIKGSNITADTVNGEAATDSLIVSVGAGIAVGGKTFNGAGSGSWNDLKNDTKVTFENNDITGKTISEQAHNTSSIINIAGEVAGGKGMALGLSLAYNSLNNTTGTYLTGNTVTLQDENNATAIRLATTNQSKALAVAGGVNVNISQELLGAVGTVAINRGVNNTESVIDGKTTGNTVTNTTLNNVKELSVKATDVTKKTTVAGGVSVGGKKVGVGGAVAYTSIGSNNKREKLLAEINHADITTIGDGTIEVSAADSLKNANNELVKSRITSVGAGVGVEWGQNWFNLQGAAAVSDIYKTNRASLNNTNITVSSDSSTNNATNQPAAVTVTADTKSKINSVGAVANISVKSVVTAAVGIAINRMNQDTVAEMNTVDGNTTTSNVGLTQVRATGDADIHSVGVGTTVSVLERAAAAGSGSYNYIGNNVDAIIKNQNLTSNSSVGVVAQSDDRLYNFAGGFSIGAATNVALGTAVSTNKITGNTNALVSGGSIAAKDTGEIEVTRPQDEKLFTTEKLDLTTDRTKLSESRNNAESKKKKTGIVVDSSATHTLISQLSSGGVGANSTFAVNLDGTVNINTIGGKTTAKIQDANLNSNGNASNVNVNAVDYTNIGSFTGTPAVGVAAAAGVSVGVSANWDTFDRKTMAEISSASAKKNVYANNLTVDAIAKHGSSSLAFAASAGGGKVGISSGDSIMRHKNSSTTSALLKNTNAVFSGTAEIKAEHLGNSYTQNIAVGLAAGMVAVAAGAGVSVMDDTSTVTAEVTGSDLKEIEKATNNTDKKTISVLANNENNWKDTLVTVNLAVGIGAGLAANVGIHNTTGETASVVSNSHLEATDVTVKATDTLTAHGTGAVGAGGVGGAGVVVTLNNINSSVSAHVNGGSIEASNNIDVTAETEREFDSQATGVVAGGLAVGVNVAVTSINKGITQAQLSNAKNENEISMDVNTTTQNKITEHLASVNGSKGALGLSQATFYGLNAEGKADLNAARNASISLNVPDTKLQGVHTSVDSGASLTADGNVNVLAKDTSDISAKNVGVTAGLGGSVNVTDAIIHTNYDTDVTLDRASVTGKNVNINALQTQKSDGSKVTVTAVTVGALGGVGVGYAGIVNKGSTDVNITGSTIGVTKGSGEVPDTVSAENVTINATDESKHKSDILSVGVAALNVTTTFASVENYSNVGITLNDAKNSEGNVTATTNISATKDITIDAKKANALEAHTQGVGVGGVNVAVNHATIEDGGTIQETSNTTRNTGLVTAKITGTTGTFTADKFHLGATNDTTAKLSAGNTAVSVLGISRMRGKGVMTMGADVNVAGGAFNAKTVEFASVLGNANGRTLEGNVKGHNISVGAVAPDTVALTTTATSTVNVANSTFGEDTNLVLDNESYVDRKAYIYDVTVGGVAVGNSSADITGTETMTTTLTGKAGTTNKLANLLVATYGENKGKALADAGGGGLVGYVGAHVNNTSTNTVNSTLSGKWETTGEVYLVAVQKDETRLTAKEGHGGVIGVGGTSVDNTVTTRTYATVGTVDSEDNPTGSKDNPTEITADRVHVGTGNSVTTGAYDDVDNKGNKDAQTYTLQDHFGGAISGNRLRSKLEVTETGTVTIGDNAKITTNKLQEYIATSKNDLTNHASAKGGGAVAVTDTVTENILTINNTVDVKKGALLSNEKAASTEDIILSAYDEHSLKSHADATVGGAVGVLVGKNLTTMNRTSNVNMSGTIESGSNVGLYAGANEDGVLSNLNVDLKAGVYNYTAIPVSSPTVNYNITADRGTVYVNGTKNEAGTEIVDGIVRSTRDINAIASGGRENVVTDESKWAWVNGGKEINKKFLSSDAVVAEEAMPKTSTVNVTGSLIAGTADPINVTIKGSVAEGLSVEIPDELAESKANLRVKNGITEGTFDYANTLGARLAELKKLIAAYEGDATKMAAYIAERDRIQKKMNDLGLDNDSNRPVYYVEIPDIAASGGNINVQANDFTGTGKLEANSAPSITITNESDAYLKLNNIIMGEQGGQIIYNIDNVIPPGEESGNAKINEINVHETGAAFSRIYGPTESTAAGLQVLNTFSGPKTSTIKLTTKLESEIDNNSELTDAEKTQYKQDIRDEKFTYTAITDVEVNGKISNFHGNVTINNASGDIRISGGTTARPTGVEGNTVTLVAANGTIAQDYKEGIVNINGDPEKYLATQATNMKNALGLSDTNTDSKSKTENYSRSDSSQTATGYIAGRDVYVSASNINVNGLIQSGYKTYAATVTEAQLNTAKTRPTNRAAVVQNRTMYKVNDGGTKWNATDKVFDYVPQVYWDPSTDKLVVEDIDTAGGKVYLTGMIASTGQGKILAADGAAEISVINNTALDMNMGNVLNNQRQGIITIADTAKDTWTEYRRGQTRTITGYAAHLKAYAQYLKDHETDDRVDKDPYAGATVTKNNGLSVGHDLTYGVKENQTYSWVNGNSVETTQTFEHYVRKGLWGAIETVNETQLKEMSQNKQPVEVNDKKKLGLPEGAVIKQGSNNNPDSGKLQLDGSTRVLSSEIKERTHEEWRSGFLGWFKHTRDRWKTGTKTVQLYNYTLNASQPITIGLIGAEKGSINIESKNTAGGSINLTGNVANSHNEATLNISSAAGSITQFDNTTLKSEIVNLTAKNDIKNIHLASVGTKDTNGNVTDNIKLNAVSTGKGDIDITAVGGILENQSLPGNVTIVALKSRDGNVGFKNDAALGDVTLNATGNITQTDNAVRVEGRGINLTSKNGGIGTNSQAINIAGSDLTYSTDRCGAQVNAGAKGSIYLTEAAAGGDMRVGRIESNDGNVTLTVANGGFIDGLQHDDKSGSTESVDEMVHRWIDAGLIDGEKDVQGNYTYKGAYITGLEKSRDEYKANVEAAYAGKTQAQWQAEYAEQQTVVTAIYNSDNYNAFLNKKEQYDALSQEERKLLTDTYDSETDSYGNADYNAYVTAAKQYLQYSKYNTADDYMKDTAAYKYSRYADANTYLAKDTTYKELATKAANPTFEWTKEMMLYAVNDKIVNPEGGGSTQTEGSANVLGKNITLNAVKGAVGTFDDQRTTITVEDLASDKMIDNMKKLMNVSASDVTVNKDEAGNILSFDIKKNMPLGIFQKENANNEQTETQMTSLLNVQAGGDVFLAGRKNGEGDTGINSAINVGSIDATKKEGVTGNVRLHSAVGIYNAKTADDTNIKGKNLILTGGTESIGTSEKPLTVSLSGDMTEARADKNVYIKNMNQADVLRLGAMSAKNGAISLISDKGFLMSDANGNIAESYINAGKSLVFNTNPENGVVGDANHAIRILNNQTPVNITAGSAYVRGVDNSDIQNGTLMLGHVTTAGDFTAVGDGSIAVGRDEEKTGNTVTKEAVAGSITSGGNVTLRAVNGNITQTTQSTPEGKSGITANTLKTYSDKSLLLENENNKFNSVTVDGITATVKNPDTGEETVPPITSDVRIKDNADALTVAINRDVTGNISVENLRDEGTLANSSALTATGNIVLASKGDVFINNDVSTGNQMPVWKDDMTGLKTDPPYNSLTINAGGAIQEAESVTIKAPVVDTTSGNGVSMENDENEFAIFGVDAFGNNTEINGSVKVKSKVTSKVPSGNEVVDKDFTVGVGASILGDAEFTNLNTGDLGILILHPSNTNKEIKIGDKDNDIEGSLTLTANGDVNLLGDANAANNVEINSIDGSFYGIGRGIIAGNDVSVSVNDAIYYMGSSIEAGQDINMEVNNPDSQYSGIYIGGLPQGKTVPTSLTGAVTNAGATTLTAGNEANFEVSGDGNIALGGSVTAGKEVTNEDNTVTTSGGNVVAKISGTNDVPGTGDVLITGSVKAVNEGISLQTDKGHILIDGSVVAKNNVVANIGKVDEEGDLVAGTGQGNVLIAGSVESKNESVTVKTGEGRIEIGTLGEGETVTEENAVTAKRNVTVETGLGTITIQGKTITQEGDITMTAGNSNYAPETSNFIIRDDGELISGSDITLNGRNGDIQITNKIKAANGGITGGLTVNIVGQGNVDFGSNVSVLDDVDISTDKGSIAVGKTITSTNGAVSLKTDEGAIRVGKDITAKKDVAISTLAGNVTIGDTNTGDDGDVQSTSGNVTIYTGDGNINIVKTVKALGQDGLGQVGNINIIATNTSGSTSSEKGNIVIGTKGTETVTNEETVKAYNDVTVETNLGTITIQGKTITQEGDITMTAGQNNYLADDLSGAERVQNGNFIIRDDGELISGSDITLNGRNGDIQITDKISATNGGITVNISEQGNVDFGSNVNVKDDVIISTDEGSIDVGKTITSREGAVRLETGAGDIQVGKEITATTGTVSLKTGAGDIRVGKEITAGEKVEISSTLGGDILVGGDINAEKNVAISTLGGDVVIGDADTGNEGDVLSKKGDVSIQTGDGKVDIAKTVTAEKGGVDIISGSGAISVGGDITARDGVAISSSTGAITIGNLTGNGDVQSETGNVSIETGSGTVAIVKTVSADEGKVGITTGDGPILVGGDVTAADNVEITSSTGAITIGDAATGNAGDVLSKKGDVSIHTGAGTIDIVKTVAADKGDVGITTGSGAISVGGDITAEDNVEITSSTGAITIGNLTGDGDVKSETGNVSIETGNGTIAIVKTVKADGGDVGITTGDGSILVGGDVTAKEDVEISSSTGAIIIGDVATGNDGDVLSTTGDVSIHTGDGTIAIVKTVKAAGGDVGVTTGEGDILIGSNGPNVKTVTANQNVKVETDLGTITIEGKTSTVNGDITMKAGKDSYRADEGDGEDRIQNGNFIIKADGEVDSGGAVTLNGRNGDIHITDDIKAVKGINANIAEEGSVYFDRNVTVTDDVNIATDKGNIAVGNTITTTDGSVSLKTGGGEVLIGQDVTAEKDVSITNKDGDVIVGDVETGDAGHVLAKTGNVSIQADNGIVGIVKSVKAQEGSIDIQVGTGGVIIGNNGPGVETVTAMENIDVSVDLGQVKIYGKTSTEKGDISMAAGDNTYTPGVRNFIIEQNGLLESGRDINLTGRNGDLHVTDAIQATRNLNTLVTEGGGVYFDRDADIKGDITIAVQNGDVQMHNMNATGNTTIISTGSGSINGNNITSGGTTHVALTNGDLFLNLAEGKAVVLRMENNTAASRVNTVKADASGAATPDVELTGNYIQIGELTARNGNSVFQVSAMGAGNQKYISGAFSVDHLSSANGTHMPNLWANTRYMHVDEGDLAVDDVLAGNKIHLENDLTTVAIFGRTPTRDGEQLYYWNNLGMANSKKRSFQLYTDGMLRTHRAVLIDAGKYYGKLYGDNLSVVDMMRERVTNEHGQFTFNSTWLTKPGEVLREKMLFGVDTVGVNIWQQNASNGELMVE